MTAQPSFNQAFQPFRLGYINQYFFEPGNLEFSHDKSSIFDYHLQLIILICHKIIVMLDWST